MTTPPAWQALRAHSRTRHTLHGTIERAEQRLPVLHREVALLERAAAAVVDTRGERFAMTVGGQRLSGRTDAAAALRDTLLALPLASSTTAVAATPVAQLAGLTVLATALRYPEAHLRLELADVTRSGTKVELTELATYKTVGLVSRLENRAANLPATRTDVDAEIDRLRAERDRAAEQLTRPFPHATALADARTRSAALAVELTNPTADPGAGAPSPGTPSPGPGSSRDAPGAGDADATAAPAPQRWQAACGTVDPWIVDDPHWPALTAALDRADSAGLDITNTLAELTRGNPLPEQHPARDLHHRLIGACPAAVTATPPPTASTASAQPGPTPPTPPGTPFAQPAARGR